MATAHDAEDKSDLHEANDENYVLSEADQAGTLVAHVPFKTHSNGAIVTPDDKLIFRVVYENPELVALYVAVSEALGVQVCDLPPRRGDKLDPNTLYVWQIHSAHAVSHSAKAAEETAGAMLGKFAGRLGPMEAMGDTIAQVVSLLRAQITRAKD